MKPFFKAVANTDPMTAAVLGTVTIGIFAIIYVIARFFAEGDGGQ